MGTILCATRGGEASYRAQDKAIALAKQQDDNLIFLYVVDLQFLNKTAAPIVVDVEDEVTKMGEFLLLMAKERAAQQGVKANTICRKGRVREEIKHAIIQNKASLVVLGRPAGIESAFQLASLEAFATLIENETGAKTIIA